MLPTQMKTIIPFFFILILPTFSFADATGTWTKPQASSATADAGSSVTYVNTNNSEKLQRIALSVYDTKQKRLVNPIKVKVIFTVSDDRRVKREFRELIHERFNFNEHGPYFAIEILPFKSQKKNLLVFLNLINRFSPIQPSAIFLDIKIQVSNLFTEAADANETHKAVRGLLPSGIDITNEAALLAYQQQMMDESDRQVDDLYEESLAKTNSKPIEDRQLREREFIEIDENEKIDENCFLCDESPDAKLFIRTLCGRTLCKDCLQTAVAKDLRCPFRCGTCSFKDEKPSINDSQSNEQKSTEDQSISE